MHFTILETAGILGISPEAVFARIKSKALAAVSQPGTEGELTMVTRESLIKYILRPN